MTGSATATGKVSLEANIRRYFGGRALVAIIGIITIPMLTRALGVSAYGQLNLLFTLSTWVPVIVSGWLQQSALRYHQAYLQSEDAEDYRRTLGTLRSMVAIVAAAATFVAVPALCHATQVERLLISLLAGAAALNVIYTAVALGEQKAALIVWSDAARIAAPALVLCAVLLGRGEVSRTDVALYFLLGMVLANIALSWLVRSPSRGKGAFVRPIARKLIAFGMPMGIWTCLTAANLVVGRVILQVTHQPEALGVYASVQEFLTKIATVLFMPITYALHGYVMASWAEGEYGLARQSIKRAHKYQSILAVALLIGLLAGHGALGEFLFGTAHDPIVAQWTALLAVTVVAVISANFGLVSHKGLELAERTGSMAVVMAVSVAVNITISLILAPRIGALGAAIGLLAGSTIYAMVTQALSAQFLRTSRATA